MKYKIIFYVLLIVVMLTGCSKNVEELESLTYIGFSNGIATFEREGGRQIKFYSFDRDVELLVKNQKYDVFYYYNDFRSENYWIREVAQKIDQ